MGCDTVLPDGHERPAIACDRVAHHVGRTSITEQTNGRTMDAQPKQDQRLVPSHLTDAEHVITSLYECPWRSSEGQFADEDGAVPALAFCSCAAPLRRRTPTTPISPGTRTHASRAARAVLPRSRRASSAALRPWQGEGQAGSRGGSRGGASRPLGRRGARRGQRAARASARSPGDLGSRACPSSGSTRWHEAPGARRADAGRTAKRGRGPRCARRDGGETQRSRIRWLKGGTRAALQLRRCRTPASGPAGAARG